MPGSTARKANETCLQRINNALRIRATLNSARANDNGQRDFSVSAYIQIHIQKYLDCYEYMNYALRYLQRLYFVDFPSQKPAKKLVSLKQIHTYDT